MGYNSGVGGRMTQNSYNWVGDLIVEADVTVNNPAGGDVVFELSKGVDRFQARFTLADGTRTLVRIAGGKETTLGAKPTDLGKSGKHHVRFSNVDGRLTLWVDRCFLFGDGVDYPAAVVPDGPHERIDRGPSP